MKTYKDGLLEAAKVVNEYLADRVYTAEMAGVIASFKHGAIKRIEALAAQEDQPQEQSADDLLRRAMVFILEELPFGNAIADEIAAHLKRKEVNKEKRMDTWDAHGNYGMEHPEESDLSGGETDQQEN